MVEALSENSFEVKYKKRSRSIDSNDFAEEIDEGKDFARKNARGREQQDFWCRLSNNTAIRCC